MPVLTFSIISLPSENKRSICLLLTFIGLQENVGLYIDYIEPCVMLEIISCLWPCSLAVPVLAGWVYGFVVLCPGTPEGSTGSCSGFKASQKTGQQL